MYYAISDFHFWFFGLLSIGAMIVSCYLPGWLLIQYLKIESKLTETVLSFVSGMVLWAFQGFIFGHTHIRWATYIYLVVTLFFAWKNRKNIFHSLKSTWSEVVKTPKIILLAIVVAVFFQSYAHIGSGLLGPKGLGFYFVNAADGMLHLGYIQSMVTTFPPLEPGYAGMQLVNYHYWSDLVFAEFNRVWHLPIINSFFQYLPLTLVLATTIFWVQLIRFFKGSTITVLVGLFLLTFGADAAFIFALYFNSTWGANLPALDTGVSFIFNMPQVFSRLVFLGSIFVFLEWLKTKNPFSLIVLVLLGSSLFGFKVYYGLYFVMGYGFYTLLKLIRDFFTGWKKTRNFIKTTAATFSENKYILLSWVALLILAATIFLPNNRNSGGLQVEPLAWPKVFLSDQNLNYKDWWLRMQVYEAAGNYRNITIYNAWAIVITLISIYGIRLIGLLPLKSSSHSFPKELLFFLIPTNIIFMIIGFVYFQVSISGGLNIYNFLITPILAFNLFAAFTITNIKDVTIKALLVSVIIALCLPRTFLQLKEYFDTYYSQRPSQVVSNDELELLSHLRNLEDGHVQADYFNAYENTTPYVAFLSNKVTFVGGKKLLETHNIATKQREKEVEELFKAESAAIIAEKMRQLNLTYLYITDTDLMEKFLTAAVEPSPLVIEKQNAAGVIISAK